MTSKDEPERYGRQSGPPNSQDQDRFERARLVFQDAIHIPPPEREQFLSTVCAGDAALRHEVNDLLSYHDRDNVHLDSPLVPRLDQKSLTGVRLDHYLLGKPLGEGGMGVVYQASDDRTKAEVAIKVLRQDLGSPAAATRFRLEIRTLEHLAGRGIARLLDAGTTQYNGRDLSYYVMEKVNGASLSLLTKEDPRRAIALLQRLCEAVGEAHSQGVIHRDLKPENVIVREDGQPIILDFGISRTVDPDRRSTDFATSTGHVLGTVAYMSPEQLVGDSNATGPQSDVYSLGVIAFELLTGTRPHESSDTRKTTLTQAGALLAIERRDAPLVSSRRKGLGSSIDAIVFKALEREPRARYANAADLAGDFAAYLRGTPVAAPKQTKSRQIWNRVRRAPGRAIAFAVTALLVITAAGGVTRALQDRQEDALVQMRLSELWSLLSQVDQELHQAGSRTEASIRESLVTLEESRKVLRTMPRRPFSPRLLRFIDWRSGEARYFLGSRTQDVEQFHLAAGHWTDAQQLALSQAGTLTGLDDETRLYKDIENIDLAIVIGGRGLAYASIAMFEDRAQFLRRAVSARQSSLHHHEAELRNSDGADRIPHQMAVLNFGATLIEYGVAVDSLALVEQGIDTLEPVRDEEAWPGFRSAFAAMEYTVGLAQFYRWQKSGRPEDLTAAETQFRRSLGIRGEGSGSSLHIWDQMELARLTLWQSRGARRDADSRRKLTSARNDLDHARANLNRERKPFEYASIDILDAQLVAELGKMDSDARNFVSAESLLVAAETTFSREKRPLQHAELQVARALVLNAGEPVTGLRAREIGEALGVALAIVPGDIWPWLRNRAEELQR